METLGEWLLLSQVDVMRPFSLQRARAQHIVPCTISQLLSATLTDEVFKIGDVEISQVCEILWKDCAGIGYKGWKDGGASMSTRPQIHVHVQSQE